MAHLPLEDHLQKWLKGNTEAIAYCAIIFRVGHVWDDLIDQDQTVSPDAIHRAFWDALIELPNNSFYTQNFRLLHPLMQMGILNWKSANRLERSSVHEHKYLAYAIRSMISDVIAMCALIIGGPHWAEEVHYEMQTTYHESMTEYLNTVKGV